MDIIKFIYTMFLFIFLFVVPTKVDGKQFFYCTFLNCCLYTIFFEKAKLTHLNWHQEESYNI